MSGPPASAHMSPMTLRTEIEALLVEFDHFAYRSAPLDVAMEKLRDILDKTAPRVLTTKEDLDSEDAARALCLYPVDDTGIVALSERKDGKNEWGLDRHRPYLQLGHVDLLDDREGHRSGLHPDRAPMSADTRAVKTARRMVAAFWCFTVLYLVVIAALLITLHDVLGVIFIAVLACSWFFLRWPDAKPHFAVLRDARRMKDSSSNK